MEAVGCCTAKMSKPSNMAEGEVIIDTSGDFEAPDPFLFLETNVLANTV